MALPDDVKCVAGFGGFISIRTSSNRLSIEPYFINIDEWKIRQHYINNELAYSGNAGYIRRDRIALDWEFELSLPWDWTRPAEAILMYFQDLHPIEPHPEGLLITFSLGYVGILNEPAPLPPIIGNPRGQSTEYTEQLAYRGFGIIDTIDMICSSKGDDIIRMVARGRGNGPLALGNISGSVHNVWRGK